MNKKFLLTIAMIMSLVMAVSCGDTPTNSTGGNDGDGGNTPTVSVDATKINAFLKQLKTPSGTAAKIDVVTDKSAGNEFIHFEVSGITTVKAGNDFNYATEIVISDKKGDNSTGTVTTGSKGVKIDAIKAAIVAALKDSTTGLAGTAGQATGITIADEGVTVAITDKGTDKNATVTLNFTETKTKATGKITFKLKVNGQIGVQSNFKFLAN